MTSTSDPTQVSSASSNTGSPRDNGDPEESPPREHSLAEGIDPTRIPSRPESPVNSKSPPETESKTDESKKPDLEESWEVIMKQVRTYDQETYKSRTSDLDTLLVFTGLLSAVVTAFTIESYQWLREDPADVTVALLTQISQQIGQSNSSSSSSTTPQSQPFHPASSSVRINCFWFLSLILSLTTSLFALLCKQWLYQNYRDVSTWTPQDSLALRQMRHDSLEKGKVPMLLATLPVLLQAALLLFFAGILDLFWSLKVVPLFVIGCITIGASGCTYCITTIIPGLTIMSMVRREVLEKWPGASPNRLQVYQSTWPYKSPQAWVFLKLIASIPSISPWLLFGTSAGTSMGRKPNIQVLDYLSKPWLRFRHENWARVDARFLNSWWPGQVGQKSDIGIHLWEGIKNIIPILRDTISLQPFLIILESYPLMITLPLAFPYFYRLYTWMDFDDVNRKLDSFFPRMNPAFFTSLYQTLGIPLTGFGPMFSEKEFIVRIVTNNLKLDREPEQLNRFVEEAREISRANMPKRTRINFTLFFHVGQHLWERGQGIELLDIYKDEWSSYSSSISQNHDRISMGGDERYQLIASFARYINTRLDLPEPSHPRETEPVLVTRKGLEFLRFIHDQIIQHKLYDIARYHRITVWPVRSEREIMKEWAKAMEVIRRLKGLPEDYFVEFPPEGSNDSNQESEATVGKLRELCNGISAFIRKALTRRAEDAPNSQA